MFVPAGLHSATEERRHLDRLARAGADLFEVGLAHRTPVLDGPVIQSAYRCTLQRGKVLDRTLRATEHAAFLRPTVVMTYWEPVSRHGSERLARLFAVAGAAGVMVVDLPAPMAARWHGAARAAGLRTPRLVPRHVLGADFPSATAEASGWLYAPASAAPTGYQGARSTSRPSPTSPGAFAQRARCPQSREWGSLPRPSQRASPRWWTRSSSAPRSSAP
ncbi:tryptophan synthase subunit alpha [Streptomyces sioyaensis]|uniref:tryptophan synthase subunit alpha n=1 Tax=Streptomyces sioyaensis TaxID=67364 RepID=UPI0033E5DEBC